MFYEGIICNFVPEIVHNAKNDLCRHIYKLDDIQVHVMCILIYLIDF